ncbi:MAG: hypothetical protein JO199_14705, partial [Candidatus Eremiobacteraeota bacterium]|nr:hypothetical protein [Candidatus Eremiobacteraeota bacterium]
MRRLRAMWATLFAVAALGGCASVVPAARPTLAQAQAVPAAKVTPVAMPTCFTAYCRRNAIPVRWQWMNNAGYCGETALIAAGLYYGQYTSQYVARQLASGAQWSTNPNGY